jgi:alpha-amylase
MTSEGGGWFVATIPNAGCANIVFSNNGSPQTADLYRCGEGWYDNGVWYSARSSSISSADVVEREAKMQLRQNYPNPVTDFATISFTLAEKSPVTLRIYNPQGVEVEMLLNNVLDAGTHEVQFDASRYNSGLYVYRLQSGRWIETRKLLVTKK